MGFVYVPPGNGGGTPGEPGPPGPPGADGTLGYGHYALRINPETATDGSATTITLVNADGTNGATIPAWSPALLGLKVFKVNVVGETLFTIPADGLVPGPPSTTDPWDVVTSNGGETVYEIITAVKYETRNEEQTFGGNIDPGVNDETQPSTVITQLGYATSSDISAATSALLASITATLEDYATTAYADSLVSVQPSILELFDVDEGDPLDGDNQLQVVAGVLDDSGGGGQLVITGTGSPLVGGSQFIIDGGDHEGGWIVTGVADGDPAFVGTACTMMTNEDVQGYAWDKFRHNSKMKAAEGWAGMRPIWTFIGGGLHSAREAAFMVAHDLRASNMFGVQRTHNKGKRDKFRFWFTGLDRDFAEGDENKALFVNSSGNAWELRTPGATERVGANVTGNDQTATVPPTQSRLTVNNGTYTGTILKLSSNNVSGFLFVRVAGSEDVIVTDESDVTIATITPGDYLFIEHLQPTFPSGQSWLCFTLTEFV